METYYEYCNKEIIEKNLLCTICQKPFLQPVITSSGDTFCRQCIEQNTTENKDLIPLTDASILDALDELLVVCTLCDEGNIKRGDFENHMMNRCPKAIVTCLASENDCHWLGLREELPIHLNTCSHKPSKESCEDNSIGKFFPTSSINFQARQFHGQDTAIAAKALLIHKRSTCLDLFNKGISSTGASIIASVLPNDIYLETLNLRGNLICDSGVQFLARALATNSHLKQLDLNGTAITDTGVRLLTDMLQTNECLIKLTLSFNRITNEGLQLLIDVLINYNSTLQSLSLRGNVGIDNSSTDRISHFIRHNQSLKTLNLEDCNLSKWHKKRIHFLRKIHFKSHIDILL